MGSSSMRDQKTEQKLNNLFGGGPRVFGRKKGQPVIHAPNATGAEPPAWRGQRRGKGIELFHNIRAEDNNSGQRLATCLVRILLQRF